MSTAAVSQVNLSQMGMNAFVGGMLGALSSALGLKIYQKLNPGKEVNLGKATLLSGAIGAVFGAASCFLDSKTTQKVQEAAMQVLILEIILLIAMNAAEETQLVKYCITEPNREICLPALKETLTKTVKKAGPVIAICSTGPTPHCGLAVVNALLP